MKRFLIALLALAVMLPAGAKTPKKVKEQPLLWPDGTPVPEWFLNAEVPAPESLGKVYNLRDLGVESNPNLVQTAAIQAVIDKAAAEGGGVVVIPEGIYKSGALFFKQGTHLHLKRGAMLLGSESILDFPVTTTRIEGEVCRYFPALINIDHLDGFTLTGNGTIEGNGLPYWRAFGMRARWKPNWTNKDEQRPRLVHVSHSTNVILADAALQNSPFWTCHIYKSDHVRILNLRLYSPRNSASADGIDLDACTNVLVKGCRITVNDDAVCFKGGKGPWADQDPNNGANENILVEDVFFDHTTGSCVTCGSECIQTRNIIVRNCTVEQGQNLLQLKMRPDTPQHYEFIRLENIKGSCAAVLLCAPWTQFFDLKDREDIPRSYGEHIVFKDLDLECRAFANVRRVDDQYTLNDITFDNVKVQTGRPDWERGAIDNLTVKDTYVNDIKQ